MNTMRNPSAVNAIGVTVAVKTVKETNAEETVKRRLMLVAG